MQLCPTRGSFFSTRASKIFVSAEAALCSFLHQNNEFDRARMMVVTTMLVEYDTVYEYQNDATYGNNYPDSYETSKDRATVGTASC